MVEESKELDFYYTIEDFVRDEIKVRGSKFIASVSPAKTKEEAHEFHARREMPRLWLSVLHQSRRTERSGRRNEVPQTDSLRSAQEQRFVFQVGQPVLQLEQRL